MRLSPKLNRMDREMKPHTKANRDKAPLFIPYDPASKSVRGRLKSQVSAHVARRAWRNGRSPTHASRQPERSEPEGTELPTQMVTRDGRQVNLMPLLKKAPTNSSDTLTQYLFEVYMPIFLPGINPSAWIELSQSSPAMYYSLLFKAQAQHRMQKRDAICGREGHDTELYRKGVQEVNRAMSNPDDEGTDAIICAVASLAFNKDEGSPLKQKAPRQSELRDLQWLRMVSSYEAKPEHVSGLLSLLQRRGGIHNIKLAGAAQALSYGDIRDATRYLRHPGFPFIALGSADVGRAARGTSGLTRKSTNLTAMALRNYFLPSKGYAFANIAAVIDIIVEYVDLVHAISPGGINYQDAQLVDSRNLTQHYLISLSTSEELTKDPLLCNLSRLELDVYELSRLSAMVFSLLAVFPLPPATAPFGQLAQKILFCLKETVRDQIPADILVWVLYMGAVASIGHDYEHGFFVSMLKTTHVNQVSDWTATRARLLTCLWDCKVSDPDGIEIWKQSHFEAG